MEMPFAVLLIADLICDADPGTGDEGSIFEDPDDFVRFVAQHTWRDPASMAYMAEAVGNAMNQAWSWRMHEKSEGRDVPR
jgi:hypothetical protein